MRTKENQKRMLLQTTPSLQACAARHVVLTYTQSDEVREHPQQLPNFSFWEGGGKGRLSQVALQYFPCVKPRMSLKTSHNRGYGSSVATISSPRFVLMLTVWEYNLRLHKSSPALAFLMIIFVNIFIAFLLFCLFYYLLYIFPSGSYYLANIILLSSNKHC